VRPRSAAVRPCWASRYPRCACGRRAEEGRRVALLLPQRCERGRQRVADARRRWHGPRVAQRAGRAQRMGRQCAAPGPRAARRGLVWSLLLRRLRLQLRVLAHDRLELLRLEAQVSLQLVDRGVVLLVLLGTDAVQLRPELLQLLPLMHAALRGLLQLRTENHPLALQLLLVVQCLLPLPDRLQQLPSQLLHVQCRMPLVGGQCCRSRTSRSLRWERPGWVEVVEHVGMLRRGWLLPLCGLLPLCRWQRQWCCGRWRRRRTTTTLQVEELVEDVVRYAEVVEVVHEEATTSVARCARVGRPRWPWRGPARRRGAIGALGCPTHGSISSRNFGEHRF
jgi:hypothetical protein